jgi:glycosyltransferase involved in cell wall biosynthesis
MSREPLVSVVTPVYNGGAYLRECIDSVLKQTYSNWEYVIVDNHSTDDTLSVAREYVSRDPRIRIVCGDSFVPVYANHNRALRQISPDSKYCKMLFADDWLFPECLSRMVEVAEAHPSVAIVGAYGLRGTKVAWDGLPYPSTVIDGRALCRNRLLGGPFVFGAATSLMLRSDVVRARPSYYNESNIHADTEACMDVLREWDFGFVHQVLTFTRTENDGMTSAAVRNNTYLTGYLHDLVHYGSAFLEPAEFQRCLTKHLWWYYDYLGHSALHFRGREFWDYHRQKMRELGHPIRVSTLALATVRNLGKRVVHPGSWRAVAKGVVGRAAGARTGHAAS